MSFKNDMVNQEDDIKHSYALTPPSLLIDIKFKDLFLFRFYFIIIFWADPVNFVHNPFFFTKVLILVKDNTVCVLLCNNWGVNCISMYNAQLIDILK